ncbi:MAG TPA: hypothetical protein VLE74_01820 [Candidatus Saccharimonadales bacterium]|nr:hypothetical protein [Candidatus Saccharimonadales bacterium]
MDEQQNTPLSQPGDTPKPTGPSGQVMDIQVKSGNDSSESAAPIVPDNADPTTVESDPMVDETANGTTTPAFIASVEPSAPAGFVNAPESVASEPAAPSSTQSNDSADNSVDTPPTDTNGTLPNDNPLAARPQPIKQHKAPVVAILLAVIVAVALASLVVFMFLKNRNNQSASRAQTSASQTVAPKPQASASDVDATNQQIDSSLKKTDDSKDFSTSDLSDTSLGL